MEAFEHERVVLRTGERSGLPVIVALHSTALGPAVGGCRIRAYDDWHDGLDDALRLASAMTAKCAMAGMPNGGGKTVVAAPAGGGLDEALRRRVLLDVGDAVAALDGRYATAPDVGTTPDDMVVIGTRTGHVLCRPPEHGGSGGSAPHTAVGTYAAVRAVCGHLHGTPDPAGRRVTVVGLGNVGGRLARLLAEAGADLLVSDVDPAKKALAGEIGARWCPPERALTADADILVPAALGGVLTEGLVPRLRCGAIVGPANNQLAAPAVAGLLHTRGITWVPDYVASAGGIIGSLSQELYAAPAEDAEARVRGIEATVRDLLASAAALGVPPETAAREEVARRLRTAGSVTGVGA